jgi:hypothetical protein
MSTGSRFAWGHPIASWDAENHQAASLRDLLGKRDGQLSGYTLTDRVSEIANLFHPSGGESGLVVADGDDPIVTQAGVGQLRREKPFEFSHIIEGGGDGSRWDEVNQPKCEGPLRSSHVGEGGGDTLLETSEVNPLFNPQFEFRQQSVNHWLVRDQLKIQEVELTSKVKDWAKQEQLRDLDHYLGQAQRLARVAKREGALKPCRHRDLIIEEFLSLIYGGFKRDDPDILRIRGWAFSDCLGLLDEREDDYRPSFDQLRLYGGLLGQRKRRKSAAAGLSVLAPE